jgi:hypothetical protein
MPPSPATPRAHCPDRSVRSCHAWRRAIALMWLCLLSSLGTLFPHGAQAQGMPPAVNAPTDPFHQPCVEIRGRTDLGTPESAKRVRPIVSGQSERVLKRYVDLDDRCANLPEFAPTRDTDTTTVWYVSMPLDAVPGPHGTAHTRVTSSPATLPSVAS